MSPDSSSIGCWRRSCAGLLAGPGAGEASKARRARLCALLGRASCRRQHQNSCGMHEPYTFVHSCVSRTAAIVEWCQVGSRLGTAVFYGQRSIGCRGRSGYRRISRGIYDGAYAGEGSAGGSEPRTQPRETAAIHAALYTIYSPQTRVSCAVAISQLVSTLRPIDHD